MTWSAVCRVGRQRAAGRGGGLHRGQRQPRPRPGGSWSGAKPAATAVRAVWPPVAEPRPAMLADASGGRPGDHRDPQAPPARGRAPRGM